MIRAALTTPFRPRPLLRKNVALGTRASARLWSHDGTFVASGTATHGGIEIGWIEEGQVRYRVGRQEIDARPGDVVVVPAQAEHVTFFHTAVRAVAFSVDPSLVVEIADAVCTGGATAGLQIAGVVPTGAIPTLARLLEQEILRQAAGWRLAVDALLEAVLIELLRARCEGAGTGVRDPRIAAALDAIETRYAESVTVDDLARAANMSRFYFSRLFREQVGEAPYQRLLRVRVARAAELLRRGRRSVTEAALDVGFRDLGRFSRAFRAQIGCLPRDLARDARTRFVDAASEAADLTS